MDSPNVSQSILQSSDSAFSVSSNNEGFFDGLKNINATTWLLIILILAFLGFNIFVYLAKGPLIGKIFGTTALVAGQAVDVSAEGAKVVVGETAGAIESGLTAVQNITPNGAPSTIKGQKLSQQQNGVQMDQSTLNKALNTAQQNQQQQYDYQANEATSSVHGNQSGWCYIGEDRGYRTCAQIGANDTCMSGDIFPTQEICMNPNLRA
jgi:hypothetical protein